MDYGRHRRDVLTNPITRAEVEDWVFLNRERIINLIREERLECNTRSGITSTTTQTI